MHTQCSICARPDVEQINVALFNGLAMTKIRDKFGCSLSALSRHKAHAKTQFLAAQRTAETIKDPSAVILRISELDRRAETLYNDAMKHDDRVNAIRAVREMREILSLYAKLTGELNNQVIHQHLHIDPEWMALRAVMLRALQPYPEARAALIAAIEGHEMEAACRVE